MGILFLNIFSNGFLPSCVLCFFSRMKSQSPFPTGRQVPWNDGSNPSDGKETVGASLFANSFTVDAWDF